ncbi:MAG: sigma-70 family RNA polymerase sigma factor [Burkholderiales bacterium]
MEMSAQVFGSLIQDERDYLYRFALTKLRDPVDAEEAVQETLLAGLESGARFEGKSTLRTWLTAILKFKIIDTHRRHGKQPLQAASFQGQQDDDKYYSYDSENVAATWGDPYQALEQKRFFGFLENCLSDLPPSAARAFYMREIEGAETEAICRELRITSSNCWVVLHRAREALKTRLEQEWVTPTGKYRRSGRGTKSNPVSRTLGI